MSTAAQTGESRVVLDNVSWATFEALVTETGPRRGRLAYEEGTLEIMSPSAEHEIIKSGIGLLVEAYAQEMGIDMAIVGSTTLKRQLKHQRVPRLPARSDRSRDSAVAPAEKRNQPGRLDAARPAGAARSRASSAPVVLD
jgi:Uma2 family endonuclease